MAVLKTVNGRQRIAQHSRPLATYLIHLNRWTHITVSLMLVRIVMGRLIDVIKAGPRAILGLERLP
jgi:hypothetical protein